MLLCVQNALSPRSSTSLDVTTMSGAELQSLVQSQAETIAALRQQLDWFRRQLFGQKSERFVPEPDPMQLHLGEVLPIPAHSPEKLKSIPAHTRRVAQKDGAESSEELPFFDESTVPVDSIVLVHEEAKELKSGEFELIGEKITYRLAQRPGSYVILKYHRPVTKRKDTEEILTAPAPSGFLEGSRADVSFAAGLLMDKFAWHLPLYRQHQRLAAAGITVSRPWLTQLAQQSISLLEPIYQAQFASIRASRVKTMDETPIKAGRSGHGKMQTGYFWPVYGEENEVCFPFHPSRSADFVACALGLKAAVGSVLLTDGYAAYQRYAEKVGITHAQCWSHSRRGFFEALDAEPTGAACALEQIKAMYAVEEHIRNKKLTGEAKQIHRLMYSKPMVEYFFAWVDQQLARQGFTPSNPYIQALNYVRERRSGLEVFLTDPDVPIDTNHIERALRVIPMGRKSWLFCWTELGAKHVGIIQSLIVTCRLHGVDPYTYLVDVLQRVSLHPASRVAELTPRLWKQHFADNPLRSDLHAVPA
ncbi:MAG: IS66 family transposase [Pseudonocardiaceae bacterium]